MSAISYHKLIESLVATDASKKLFSVWLNLKFGLFRESVSNPVLLRRRKERVSSLSLFLSSFLPSSFPFMSL